MWITSALSYLRSSFALKEIRLVSANSRSYRRCEKPLWQIANIKLSGMTESWHDGCYRNALNDVKSVVKKYYQIASM